MTIRERNGITTGPGALLSRRSFLAGSATAGLGIGVAEAAHGASTDTVDGGDRGFTFGVVTDLHYADREPGGTRHYRDSLHKLGAFVDTMNTIDASFVIELGDLVDKAEPDVEAGYVRAVTGVYGRFRGDRHFVLGNHCVATFSKDEFMRLSGMRAPHYSFDAGGLHFIVLDAGYNPDGTPYDAGNFDWRRTIVPEHELDWLRRDLDGANGRATFVFVHQCLDDIDEDHRVDNADEVRAVLEGSGIVRTVFNGHRHSGGFSRIAGIPYLTVEAAVEGPWPENNAYAAVRVGPDGMVKVRGYGAVPSRDL